MPEKRLSHSQRTRAPAANRAAYEQDIRMRDPALRRAKQIRSSRQWRTVRARHLAQYPLCADPEHRHETAVIAVQVDHITSVREAPALAFYMGNLQSLCRQCHARKSAQERLEYAKR